MLCVVGGSQKEGLGNRVLSAMALRIIPNYHVVDPEWLFGPLRFLLCCYSVTMFNMFRGCFGSFKQCCGLGLRAMM